MLPLLYKTVNPNLRSFSKLLSGYVRDFPPGGRFYFNLTRALIPVGGDSYHFRKGVWSDPFDLEIHDKLIMPEYDSDFNLTFEDICNRRAADIINLINTTDRQIILQWSGGIDSTVALISLIKNLSSKEKEKITVALSGDSIIEYPHFFEKYIRNKFKTIDSQSMLFNDYKEKYEAFTIACDTGDCLFGAELGNKLYPRMKFIHKDTDEIYRLVSNKDFHFSNYKNLIIQHFNNNLLNSIENMKQQNLFDESMTEYKDDDKLFGELFYEKIVHNIETSNVPLESLHDFFWWTIFNGRYIALTFRGVGIFSTGSNKESIVNDCLIQWFNTDEYQKWSMVNNNNGEKLSGPTQGLYKTAAKKYIYKFTKDDWYFTHKIKLISSATILKRNWKKYYNEFDPILGFDNEYNRIKIGDNYINKFVLERIFKHKIDWC